MKIYGQNPINPISHIFLVLSLCLFTIGSGQAEDYFVNLDAGNNGSGSLNSPWNNMDSARASSGPVSAGDTVYIWGSGNDQIFFNASDSGHQGSPITYMERPGYTVSFRNNGSGTFAYIDADTNYLTFDGIEVSYYDRGFRITGATHGTSCTGITIKNCVIHDITGYAAVNSGYGSANDLLIENTRIYNCGDSKAEHGIYLVEGDRITIKGCEIYNNSGNNIQVNTRSEGSRHVTHLIIEKNLLYNAAKGGCNGHSGSGEGNGLALMDQHNDSSVESITHAIIRNNLIYQNTDSGINFRAQNSNTNDIVNNTLWDNGQAGMEWSGSPEAHYINNISSDNDQAQVSGRTLGTVDSNLTASPGFESIVPGNRNFLKLNSNSTAALDSGSDQRSRVPDDFWGGVRWAGNGFDIGAHEYGAAPPDERVPAPPASLSIVRVVP